METQIVAKIKPEYMLNIRKQSASLVLRQNFTFLPKYHVVDLLQEHVDDLNELTKQILLSDWGTWSPRNSDQFFIQSFRLFDVEGLDLRVTLIRNSDGHKRIYLHSCRNSRYGNSSETAYISCRMTDLDDDGQFYSSEVDNELLEGAEGYSEGTWKSIDLRY